MDIEQDIQDAGLTAQRITPQIIDAAIVSEQYHTFDLSTTTVCMLTLTNGFSVLGESACASPENFNEAIGRKIARENAVQKIWQLEGYLLKEKLYQAQQKTKPRV